MKISRHLLFAFAMLCGTVIGCAKPTYTRIAGFVEGTSYSIIYEGATPLQADIEALLLRFDNSLSIYNPNSIISKVNRNEKVVLDSFFIICFNLSQKVSAESNGAFDISASPLFAVWGFGAEKFTKMPTPKQVDSLKKICGMDKISIKKNRIVKKDPRIQLNTNAVAKGYSSDVVAHFLDSKGIKNYLVEIGGEIFCKGVNSHGIDWVIAIDKPVDGNDMPGANVQAQLRVSNKGIATSGNYRKYFVIDGKKYGHTVDPSTGYPSHNNLLSATVVASDCGHADAYATVLMVLGVEGSKKFLEKHPELDAYLIYDEDGKFKTYMTKGLEDRIMQ